MLAGPPSKLYRARKFVARNKLAVGAAAAVVLSLILGIIGTSYMTIEAQQQRARAEAALKDAQQQRDRAEAESARAIATRSFLEDGDTVILRAHCERAGARRIGFGECRGTVLPAIG